MNTCGSCRYWGGPTKNYDPRSDDKDFRPCRAVIHDQDNLSSDDALDYCADDERKAEFKAIRDAAQAFVVDGSGYFAALKTRDSFGCTLWQATPGLVESEAI